MKGILEKIVLYAKQSPLYNEESIAFHTNKNTIGIQLIQQSILYQNNQDYISVGSVLENLVIAANYYGFKESIEYNNGNKDTWISVVLSPTTVAGSEDLFEQLEDLKPNKGLYRSEEIPADYLAQLVIASKESDVFTKLFLGHDAIASILPFIKKDGKSFEGNNDTFESITSWIDSLFNKENEQTDQGPKGVNMIDDTAVLFLLTALKNEKITWINLGRTYQRMIALAASLGIQYSPIELPKTDKEKEDLKQAFGYTTEEPLILLRFGYASLITTSNRQRIEMLQTTSN